MPRLLSSVVSLVAAPAQHNGLHAEPLPAQELRRVEPKGESKSGLGEDSLRVQERETLGFKLLLVTHGGSWQSRTPHGVLSQ